MLGAVMAKAMTFVGICTCHNHLHHRPVTGPIMCVNSRFYIRTGHESTRTLLRGSCHIVPAYLTRSLHGVLSKKVAVDLRSLSAFLHRHFSIFLAGFYPF